MKHHFTLVIVGLFVVVSGFAVFSRFGSRGSRSADAEVSSAARDAAVAGLNLTLHRMLADTAGWAKEPWKYGLTNQAHGSARFTSQVLPGYSPTVNVAGCMIDTVDVVSTGLIDGGPSYRVVATYVRRCGDLPSEADSLNGDSKLSSAGVNMIGFSECLPIAGTSIRGSRR